MAKFLIKNALIINENRRFKGSVLVDNNIIAQVFEGEPAEIRLENVKIIDASGKMLIPGVIDDQVHFRDPGLTHKGDINSESKAAVAGGVTSFMDMPNTNPQTTSIAALEDKFLMGADKSLANYSFYLGATNDNLEELLKINPRTCCGVKVFMGSSTGNMLVDSTDTLSRIFSEVPTLIATHCEDEATIQQNKAYYTQLYGEDLSVKYHPLIRNAEACYRSSAFAVDLATKYDARLHVLHISTEKEMELFRNDLLLKDKKITSEVCVHHLWFSDTDYEKYGNRIKWNPAVKAETDRLALIEALKADKIDVVATDHAPHLPSEKEGSCLKAASGGPLVQHSLVAMLQMVSQGIFSYETIIRKMCHAPADLYRVNRRGYIRQGYFADLVLVDPNNEWTVDQNNILYKCAWSPFESFRFGHRVTDTWVNGQHVYQNGLVNEHIRGERLLFDL